MSDIDFSKPLQPTELIDLFPELLEELGLHEPDETKRYILIEHELLEQEHEEEMLDLMGFRPYVSPKEAEASGDEEKIDTAAMQQQAAARVRENNFLFLGRTLEPDHYLRQAGQDVEYLVYVAREEPVKPLHSFLAEIAGLKKSDITLRTDNNDEAPITDDASIATQYENFLMLVAMAEGALRAIKVDGTPYMQEEVPFTDDQIATRAFLAASDVWFANGGNIHMVTAYRQAYVIGDLTRMEYPDNNDFYFGALDPQLVEAVRTHIAYGLLTNRSSIPASMGDMRDVRVLPPRIMMRNAAAMLNRLTADAFDGDLDKHADDINLVARYMDDQVTHEDRAAMDILQERRNLSDFVALAFLATLVDGYANICAAHFEEQEKRTPGILRRARDAADTYFEIAMDDTRLRKSNLPVIRHHEVAGPPDRSMQFLERFVPPPRCRPH